MKKLILFSLLILLLGKLWQNKVLAADPHFFLSPASGSYSQNFNIEIRVDTGNQEVEGIDVYLGFPQNLLRIESVSGGTAFEEISSIIKNEEGKLRIAAYFKQLSGFYSGNNGLVATINFQPLASGQANVNFICESNSTIDSNIVEKTTLNDIIVCSANINGSYEIKFQEENQPTSTPTPGLTPPVSPSPLNSTPISTATPIPSTGYFENILWLIGLGIVLLLTGLIVAF